MRGLLIVVASLVARKGLSGAWASVVWRVALVAHGMWSLLPEVKLVSPALTGGCLTSRLPGKSYFPFFFDSDHSAGCEVMPHCGFDLHFLDDR